MLKTLSFGAVILDIIEDETFLGGDALNVAANLQSLGADSHIFTRIGNDGYGAAARAKIKEMGVNTKYVQEDVFHVTGHSRVTFNSERVPSYQFAKDASDEYIAAEDGVIEEICSEKFDVFWYSSYCQFGPASRAALMRLLHNNNFKLVFCDINIRRNFHGKEMLADLFRFADILKMNEEEARLSGTEFYGGDMPEKDLAARLTGDFDLELLCITRGGRGCSLYAPGGERLDSPAAPFPVVDTVGAGDAFSSAFIVQYCRTGDLLKAAEWGNFLGGFTASRKGAITGIPEEIYEQLDTGLFKDPAGLEKAPVKNPRRRK